jgi:uncharacterized protein
MDNHEGTDLLRKQMQLERGLAQYASLGVAFSGGVDSTLLLAAARQVLGEKVVALTGMSPVHPSGEKAQALEMARQLGVHHICFETRELADPHFAANPPERCYHCKIGLFNAMRRQAEALGIGTLAHGANVDDLSDFRPGFKAAKEMGIVAPLIDAGLGKAEIRQLARRMGLPNWDRPAMACLASRIPYGIPIETGLLARIDQAESALHHMGIDHCRVRHHGTLARIEVDPGQVARLAAPGLRDQVVAALRAIGYSHVCLDLEGYTSGKMNRDLERQANPLALG